MSAATKIGICTDSTAQLPPAVCARFGIEVVPLTVTIDGHEYLDGVDLDANTFYARCADGAEHTIDTSRPSPGQFAAAYEDLIDRGCTEIVSIHVGAGLSGTLNSARLAAHKTPVPVRVVDSGSASFGVGCCVWSAAEAIEAGASLDEVVKVVEAVAPTVGSVFVVDGGLARRSGLHLPPADPLGYPVLSLDRGEVVCLDRAATIDAAVQAMAARVVAWGDHLRVGIGVADCAATPIALAVEAAVCASANVAEVVRYRVGPSVGAHTGPGTVGCFMYPGPLPAPAAPTAP